MPVPHPRRATTPTGPAVLTFPPTHPYVEAVLPAGVVHLGSAATTTSWAPDPLWEPERWARAGDRVDVVHVHFGFDHVPPHQLARWVEVTRRRRARLVVTVHDLRNPHHVDARLHLRQLAVLLDAADVVMTLTRGAADEIRRRFGRDAVVVAHPAVFPGPAASEREPGLVGIHLKSYRVNLGDDVVSGVLAAAAGARDVGGRLEVSVHADAVRDRRTEAVCAALAGRPDASVVVRGRLDDEALREYLTGLSVSVQLHRWGTHSGWVEACHDVGTTVVAPAVGYAAEQWDRVVGYPVDEADGPDPTALRRAVAVAAARTPAVASPREWRRRQLAEVHAAHAAAYAS